MTQERQDRRLDYVEFPATDIERTKRFYRSVFGWSFKDWGPDYTSFFDGRLNGGFTKVDHNPGGGPLVVIYTTDLATMREKVDEHGGRIVKDSFEFPGGRRFHFEDPGGNVLAIWSDK